MIQANTAIPKKIAPEYCKAKYVIPVKKFITNIVSQVRNVIATPILKVSMGVLNITKTVRLSVKFRQIIIALIAKIISANMAHVQNIGKIAQPNAKLPEYAKKTSVWLLP